MIRTVKRYPRSFDVRSFSSTMLIVWCVSNFFLLWYISKVSFYFTLILNDISIHLFLCIITFTISAIDSSNHFLLRALNFPISWNRFTSPSLGGIYFFLIQYWYLLGGIKQSVDHLPVISLHLTNPMQLLTIFYYRPINCTRRSLNYQLLSKSLIII